MTPPRKKHNPSRPDAPIRGRVVVLIILVLLFPFAARKFFDAGQAVMLLSAVTVAIAALLGRPRLAA